MTSSSAINIQHEIIIETVRNIAPGEWKILVQDEGSQKILDCVKEDDMLGANITNVERIEDRRPTNSTTDAIYILSPQPHIVDCLMADLERRRYRTSNVVWTSALSHDLRARLDQSPMARQQIVLMKTLNIDFYPRESHLITFRDPWSFPVLFHPACNPFVRKHMEELALKIVSVCVSLGEYPAVRFFNPQNPTHEAAVLCAHLARFVQLELDQYAKTHEDFPPTSSRPRGTLIITDRSMDLYAPLIHEFTYQAMVHDLLPIIEGDKLLYRSPASPSDLTTETKMVEISEKDSIWVANRHLHMKDLIGKLVGDFEKFRAKNPQFGDSNEQPNNLNTIKDMLAGLPQFQEGKELYSLHLGMAQEAVNVFQKRRLADIATVEQSLATGLDEDNKKPRNLADQVVRLLDDDAITFPDRLRLIIQYVLYRQGLLPSDIRKLLAHAQLPSQDGEVIHNLDLLGAHVSRSLKETRPVPHSFFARGQATPIDEESSLSRYNPTLKSILEAHVQGTLDQTLFPFTRPHIDSGDRLTGQESISQASLRSAKPTWARSRSSATEPRQRLIVFMAGGATYSESRACYEISELCSKDIFLTTSHMTTPTLYLRQLGDLSVDKRRLNLPSEQPRPRAPAHLFERDPSPQPPKLQVVAKADIGSTKTRGEPTQRSTNGRGGSPQPDALLPSVSNKPARKDKEKDTEKKKKHYFFSSKK